MISTAVQNACRMLMERSRVNGECTRLTEHMRQTACVDEDGRPTGGQIEEGAFGPNMDIQATDKHVIVIDAGQPLSKGEKVNCNFHRVGIATTEKGEVLHCHEAHHVNRLQFVWADHEMVKDVRLRRMQPQEVCALREKHVGVLPAYLPTDAAVKYYGWTKGDVIEIEVPQDEREHYGCEYKYREVRSLG